MTATAERRAAKDAANDTEVIFAETSEQLQLLEDSTFKAFATMAKAGLLTPVSFDLGTLEKEPSYADIEKLGVFLGAMNRSCSWWIGDWLNYAEGILGDRYAQAASATGLAEQTLMNRAYVCKHVPPTRRRVGVPFGVHALVAALPARDQNKWLDKAQKAGWGREDLRRAMRETKATDADDRSRQPTGGDDIVPGLVIEAAQQVLRDRKEYGPDYLVPREAIARLAAALGQDD